MESFCVILLVLHLPVIQEIIRSVHLMFIENVFQRGGVVTRMTRIIDRCCA